MWRGEVSAIWTKQAGQILTNSFDINVENESIYPATFSVCVQGTSDSKEVNLLDSVSWQLH